MSAPKIVSVLCYGTVGLVLSAGGISITAWEFWIVLLLMGTVDICSFLSA